MWPKIEWRCQACGWVWKTTEGVGPYGEGDPPCPVCYVGPTMNAEPFCPTCGESLDWGLGYLCPCYPPCCHEEVAREKAAWEARMADLKEYLNGRRHGD